MKLLKRNLKSFYYCLYLDSEINKDEDNYETGEKRLIYAPAVKANANISVPSGNAYTAAFGNAAEYDKIIVTDDTNCPINENSVLFIDKEPENTDAQNNEETAITVTETTVSVPVYDYTVRRVAKSLNTISIAVSKVKVS